MPITPSGLIGISAGGGGVVAYKYETISATFTADGTNTLAVTGSSLVLAYFSGNGSQTLVLNGPFKSIGSQSGETVTIFSSDGYTLQYTFFIYAGRFAGSAGLSVYVGEPISIVYTPSTSLTGVLTSPTLPSGLSLSTGGVLSGTPTTLSPSTNYLFYGSNSTNGFTVNSTISIQVNAPRVLLTSFPTTQSLTVGVPFAGVTLASLNPNPLSFSGTPPPGLSASTTSNSLTLAGTPLTPSNADASGLAPALYTIIDNVTNAFIIVTIPFKYTEAVQFTFPSSPLSRQLYSNIPMTPIQLVASTVYANTSSPITYSSVGALPAGLTLNSSTGILSGTPTSSGGTYYFVATNGNGISKTSDGITLTVSQAVFNLPSVTVPVLYVGKAMTPVSATVTTNGYTDSGVSEINLTVVSAPTGLIVTLSQNSFTISGTPRFDTIGTGSIVVSVAAANVTPATLTIPITVSADQTTFYPTALTTYAFAQNIPITPIQLSASFVYGVPVTLYYKITLPAGLVISPNGLISGTPTAASIVTSTFTVAATNGYTEVITDYNYTVTVDSLICFSTGSIPTLTYVATVSTPVTTVLRSGSTVTSLIPGYLYGLSLTPTLLSGTFGSGNYPDVVIPPGRAFIRVLGSGVSPPSTFFELTPAQTQTRTKPYAFERELRYSTTDLFTSTTPVATVDTSNITDFQPAVAGSNRYMAANNTLATRYTMNGGSSYVQITGSFPIYSVAYQNSTWYGLGSNGLYSWSSGPSWSSPSPPIVSPTPCTVDNRLVLRSVPVASIQHKVFRARATGTSIEYILTEPQAFGTSIWSFSGFNFAGFNLEQVNGTVDSGISQYKVFVSSLAPATTPLEEFADVDKQPPATSYYPYAPRLLLGGRSLTYVNSGGTTAITSSCTLQEVRDISTSVYGMVIAAGGSSISAPPSTAVSTLQYSTNQGVTWTQSTNDFTWYASSVVWGGYMDTLLGLQRAWIAIGYDISGIPGIKCLTGISLTAATSSGTSIIYTASEAYGITNGSFVTITGFTNINFNISGPLSVISATQFSILSSLAPTTATGTGLVYQTWTNVDIGATFTSTTVIGPVQFDGTNWQIFVKEGATTTIYSHDAKSSTLASPLWWTPTVTTTSVGVYPTPWFSGSFTSAALQVGITSTGPIFTSPTITGYIGYQYVQIAPIIFDTDISGSSFFLASTLPAGLAWSPAVLNTNGNVTATITGQPVILGTSIITVYAQNSTGISKITVTIVTQPIPLKTPNTTPSGYLNFIKQKVIVDSAVSSINNKALVSPVGTFLANAPQPETTAPEICCLKPSTQ